MREVVILGAGFAGLTLANELDPLAAAGKLGVTVVEGAPRFQMGLAAQWAFAGRRGTEEGARPYADRRVSKVRFVPEAATAIDRKARVVHTPSSKLPYDTLVLATGATYDPDAVPGLAQHAHNLCTMQGAMAMRDQLQASAGGTLLILVARVPFKCPPAPYEYALLADELLREGGKRDRWKILVATPEPHPLPTAGKAGAQFFQPLLDASGIECRFAAKAIRVDLETFARTGGVRRRVVFESGEHIPFDVLGAMYPHRAPKVVLESGLTDASGFVPTALGTFQTGDPHVLAVGDVAGLKLPEGRPHPKAGVFAEGQALAVAAAIRHDVMGTDAAPYEGRATCFIDAGRAGAGAAEMHLLAPGGPQFTGHAPTPEGLEGKRAFERERLEKWFR